MSDNAPAWSPAECYDHVLSSERHNDPRLLVAALGAAWTAREPRLASVAPAQFRVPLAAVLHLFRLSPHDYRGYVPKAVGSPVTRGFWRRLAACLRDAMQAGQWDLVGELALAADQAHSAERLADDDAREMYRLAAEQDPIRDPDDDLPGDRAGGAEMIRSLLRYFSVELAHYPGVYAAVALGYLLRLPPSFVLPVALAHEMQMPGLVETARATAGASRLSRPLLWQFWTEHYARWHQAPEALEALAAAAQPLVRDLAARIRSSPPPMKPVEQPEVGPPPPDAFAAMAGEAGLHLHIPPLPPEPVPEFHPPAAPMRRRRGGIAAALEVVGLGWLADLCGW